MVPLKKTVKFYALIAVGVSVFFITIWAVTAGFAFMERALAFEGSSRVLVTAAHLGDITGYTCVYSDAETDIGIYLKDGYKATAPAVGARVTWGNFHGEVKEVYDGEFLMQPADTEMVFPGSSGTPVLYKGVPIGFISGWNGNGLVRCIFY